MKHILYTITLLLAGMPCYSAPTLPAGFPTTPVREGREIAPYFTFARHTTAHFEMTRELPSGRKLKSKGFFEYRQGVGMMWLTQSPVLNAMVINGGNLSLHDANGKLLRRQDFSQSPMGRHMAGFFAGMGDENISKLTKAFHVTYSRTGDVLHMGLVPQRTNDSFLWLWIRVKNGVVDSVDYDAGKNGRAAVKFSGVHNGNEIPDKPYEINPRR